LGPPIDDGFKSDVFHPIDPSFHTFFLGFILNILICEVAPDPYDVHIYFTDVCPFHYFNLARKAPRGCIVSVVSSPYVHLVRNTFAGEAKLL
jgi:hypothetical protein